MKRDTVTVDLVFLNFSHDSSICHSVYPAGEFGILDEAGTPYRDDVQTFLKAYEDTVYYVVNGSISVWDYMKVGPFVYLFDSLLASVILTRPAEFGIEGTPCFHSIRGIARRFTVEFADYGYSRVGQINLGLRGGPDYATFGCRHVLGITKILHSEPLFTGEKKFHVK